MKMKNRRFPGRSRDATMIERSVKSMISKYGVPLVKYVTGKLLERERQKLKLKRTITEKERELAELKRQKL